jgi:hypothetical protein
MVQYKTFLEAVKLFNWKNPADHDRVHKSLPLDSVLKQLCLAHIVISCLFKVTVNGKSLVSPYAEHHVLLTTTLDEAT